MTEPSKPVWWRWPLVPLAAFGAGIGAALLMSAVQWLGVMMNWGSSHGWYFTYVAPVICSFSFGYAYVAAAEATAPSSKRTAAVVMVTLLGVFSAASILATWLATQNTTGDAVRSTLQAAVSFAAAVSYLVGRRS